MNWKLIANIVQACVCVSGCLIFLKILSLLLVLLKWIELFFHRKQKKRRKKQKNNAHTYCLKPKGNVKIISHLSIPTYQNSSHDCTKTFHTQIYSSIFCMIFGQQQRTSEKKVNRRNSKPIWANNTKKMASNDFLDVKSKPNMMEYRL